MSTLHNAFNAYGYTHNGALTNTTSGNALLDLFFLVGGARHTTEQDILKVFAAAMQEDIVGALKTLFYARDRDGGAGERRVFRVIFHSLPREIQYALAPLVPVYGRWDDLWLGGEKQVYYTHLAFVAEAFMNFSVGESSLLAKWLPRKGKFFAALARNTGLSYGNLRRRIVSLSSTVEQALCSKNYDSINLNNVPSRALLKYSLAFKRIFGETYTEFLSGGKGKNAFFYPYDIYRKAMKPWDSNEALQAMWNNIPSDFQDRGLSFLPVIDVSGSMEGTPMEMAVSLGLFLAEKQSGEFHNEFVTFSERPEFVKVPENYNIREKMRYIQNSSWGRNTNLDKVFEQLCLRAREKNVPEEEMPNALVIISDMEFDAAEMNTRSGGRHYIETIFTKARKHFAVNGYTMPKVIFWNVNGRASNVPGTIGDDIILFSGSNPKNIDKIFNFDTIETDPLKIFTSMVTENPRYDIIAESLR